MRQKLVTVCYISLGSVIFLWYVKTDLSRIVMKIHSHKEYPERLTIQLILVC